MDCVLREASEMTIFVCSRSLPPHLRNVDSPSSANSSQQSSEGACQHPASSQPSTLGTVHIQQLRLRLFGRGFEYLLLRVFFSTASCSGGPRFAKEDVHMPELRTLKSSDVTRESNQRFRPWQSVVLPITLRGGFTLGSGRVKKVQRVKK